MGILESKSHISLSAKNMDNASGIPQGIKLLPGIGKNDSVEFSITHYQTILIRSNAKIYKNHE